MGAIVGSVSFGMTTAFPATLSQNFARGDDAISIDENVESWIGEFSRNARTRTYTYAYAYMYVRRYCNEDDAISTSYEYYLVVDGLRCATFSRGRKSCTLPSLRFSVLSHSYVHVHVRVYVIPMYFSAGSVVLWMLVGVIAAGVCMRLRGRRIAQACLYVCWICGWLTASYASDVRSLLAGCALMGLSAGSHAVVSAVYVGEVTEPRFRGIISVQISLGVAAGILAGHAQGVLFAGRTALRGCAVLPAVALSLVLAFARESPSWLAFNGRVQTARSVFLRLRNEAPTSHAELNSLVEAAAAARSERNRRFATTSSGWCWCWRWGDLKRQVSSNAFRKSFLVLNVLFVVQQGSGMNVIVFHAITLLKAVSADVDLPSSAIIVDTVRFFATLTACVLVKVTGRRKLYLWSASGALLSLCALVVSTLYRVHGVILICWTCAYVVFLYLGVAPIPWIMVGEVSNSTRFRSQSEFQPYRLGSTRVFCTLCSCCSYIRPT